MVSDSFARNISLRYPMLDEPRTRLCAGCRAIDVTVIVSAKNDALINLFLCDTCRAKIDRPVDAAELLERFLKRIRKKIPRPV